MLVASAGRRRDCPGASTSSMVVAAWGPRGVQESRPVEFQVLWEGVWRGRVDVHFPIKGGCHA
eukprot:SAG31_NODE_126_length_23665_cov_6.178987_22_plen_63_part_00